MNVMSFYYIYQPIKLHFTTTYDYNKYKGKVKRIEPEEFVYKNEAQRFEYYSSKIKEREAKSFCVANFSNSDKIFIYEPYEESNKIYKEWKKVNEALTEYFENDLNFIKKNDTILNAVKTGNLLKLYLQNKITKETLIILDGFFANSFLNEWMLTTYRYDPFCLSTIQRLLKYKPFVAYEKPKLLKKIIEVIKEHV